MGLSQDSPSVMTNSRRGGSGWPGAAVVPFSRSVADFHWADDATCAAETVWVIVEATEFHDYGERAACRGAATLFSNLYYHVKHRGPEDQLTGSRVQRTQSAPWRLYSMVGCRQPLL